MLEQVRGVVRNYRPANVGMAPSNQRNFLEHSEEPYNKYRYKSIISQKPDIILKLKGHSESAELTHTHTHTHTHSHIYTQTHSYTHTLTRIHTHTHTHIHTHTRTH